MYTINIRGKQNPKDTKMVKLEIIFFKTGYARVPKVINIRAIKRLGCQVSEFPCRECGGHYQEQTAFRFANQISACRRYLGDGRQELVARPAITLLR